jgi:tRNA(Ile)-lysidine synthase
MNPPSRPPKLPDIVQDTMTRHDMIQRDSVVVVGVSGGPDSMALLHVLRMLSPDAGFGIVVGHLDHGLRLEAADDAAFVLDTAQQLAIRAVVERQNVRELAACHGVSVEEAGRRARYAFFERVRSEVGAHAIATAHHRDDALETFFLRILRGSSYRGLKGIPAKRGHIIRPLIHAKRSEIREFLEERNLPYRIDQTNLALDTDRNFIRNRLFPVIAERFPTFHAPVARSMELIEDEDAVLQSEARDRYAAAVAPADDSLFIDRGRLLSGPRALQARVVLLALYEMSGPHVRWARTHVDAILKLAATGKPSGMVHLPGQLVVSREYDRLVLSQGRPEPPCPGFTITVPGPGEVEIPAADMNIVFRLVPATAGMELCDPRAERVFFDADAVSFPLTLRTFRPGDRFRPWGMDGMRKLKKVLIDAKVPLRLRRTIPLLVKNQEILWIPRVRRAAGAPVGPETSRVVEATVVPRRAT